MADEHTPQKRDVNESFTLDASTPTGDAYDPFAELMSVSPVTDLGAPDSGPQSDGVDWLSPLGAAPVPNEAPHVDSGAAPDVPTIDDVAGLEDLYAPAGPTDDWFEWSVPTTGPPPDESVEAAADPPDVGMDHDVTAEPPAATLSTLFVGQPESDEEPVVAGRPSRPEVEGNLLFSTEPASSRSQSRNEPKSAGLYPVALVPNAVLSPAAPNKSVRVPGQVRRHVRVTDALADLTERRWFWASAAVMAGVAVFGLIATSELVANPFVARDRPDVVADNQLSVLPAAADGRPDSTDDDDTASSTGAGGNSRSFTFDPIEREDPADPSTSVPNTTSSPRLATTVVTAAETSSSTTIRSTTTTAPTTTGPTTTTVPTTAATTTTTVPTTAETTTTALTTATTPTTASTGSTPTTTSTTEPTTTTATVPTTAETTTTTAATTTDDTTTSGGDDDDPADP